jgi:hypothetical protein
MPDINMHYLGLDGPSLSMGDMKREVTKNKPTF